MADGRQEDAERRGDRRLALTRAVRRDRDRAGTLLEDQHLEVRPELLERLDDVRRRVREHVRERRLAVAQRAAARGSGRARSSRGARGGTGSHRTRCAGGRHRSRRGPRPSGRGRRLRASAGGASASSGRSGSSRRRAPTPRARRCPAPTTPRPSARWPARSPIRLRPTAFDDSVLTSMMPVPVSLVAVTDTDERRIAVGSVSPVCVRNPLLSIFATRPGITKFAASTALVLVVGSTRTVAVASYCLAGRYDAASPAPMKRRNVRTATNQLRSMARGRSLGFTLEDLHLIPVPLPASNPVARSRPTFRTWHVPRQRHCRPCQLRRLGPCHGSPAQPSPSTLRRLGTRPA